MADTITLAQNGSRVVAKIMKKLTHRNDMSSIKRRVWLAASADPAVDANSHDTYPVQVGDFAYRVDSDEAFVCSVKPTATTAATFVQMNA